MNSYRQITKYQKIFTKLLLYFTFARHFCYLYYSSVLFFCVSVISHIININIQIKHFLSQTFSIKNQIPQNRVQFRQNGYIYVIQKHKQNSYPVQQYHQAVADSHTPSVSVPVSGNMCPGLTIMPFKMRHKTNWIEKNLIEIAPRE